MDDGGVRPGYGYFVSDEQLRVFLSRSPSERLRWLDEVRALSIRLAPDPSRASWRRLKQPG